MNFQEGKPTACNGADENFAMDDDDGKQFDNNFMIVDDKRRRVSRIIVDRKRRSQLNHNQRQATAATNVSGDEGVAAGLFRTLAGFFGNDEPDADAD